jgi:RNA polymerase sigma-70 factor (ECF subfamily)
MPSVLPRRFRASAERLVFVERLEPSTQHLEDLDTARLVLRFQAGDEDSFSTLYMRYFDRIYAYLRVALGESAAAEDSAQQVFMSVWQAIPRYEVRPGVAFRRWLFIIARHQAIGELEKRGRIEVVEPRDLPDVSDGHGANGEEERLSVLDWISDRDLLLFVERLPEAQRQVLALRYILDLPYSEVAQIMGRTEVDVRTLHSRAVRFLRARLASMGRHAQESRRIRMRRPLKQPPVIGARRWALHS